MVDLFRAEWQKIVGHRWLTGFLIWSFPVGVATFVGFVFLAVLLAPDSTRAVFHLDQGRWIDDMVLIWRTLYRFPDNVFGRLPLLAFTGVIFAGEYEWGTWKNIVPHNRRVTLILAKFLALGGFVLFAITLTAVILTVGNGIVTTLAGGEYGPALTGEILADFARDYAREVTLAFISTIIVTCYAALAAMFARSIISGLLVGLLLSILEPASVLILGVVGQLANNLEVVKLYLLMPSYNLDNVAAWVEHNRALDLNAVFLVPVDVAPLGLAASVIILAVWFFGLIALTAFLFQRQDITT